MERDGNLGRGPAAPQAPHTHQGFYLTGQDVTLVGVMGALASAYVCASVVLGRNAFSAAR